MVRRVPGQVVEVNVVDRGRVRADRVGEPLQPGRRGRLGRGSLVLGLVQGEITALRARHDILQLTPLLPGGLR